MLAYACCQYKEGLKFGERSDLFGGFQLHAYIGACRL